jgi:hypothetical protein
MSREDNVAWLQLCVAEYLDKMGKLGQGFSSVDELEEVEPGEGAVHQPTYINMNLTAEQKGQVVELLKEFTDCFTWEYTEMSGLSREVVEHTLPIK